MSGGGRRSRRRTLRSPAIAPFRGLPSVKGRIGSALRGRRHGDAGVNSARLATKLGLRRAAADLASTATELDQCDQAAAREASLDLSWIALLIDVSPFGPDPQRRTTS